MDIQAERLDLITWLIEQDEVIWKKIKQLRQKSVAAPPPKRMTMEKYIAQIDESEKAIREGRVISAEELDEEMKSW